MKFLLFGQNKNCETPMMGRKMSAGFLRRHFGVFLSVLIILLTFGGGYFLGDWRAKHAPVPKNGKVLNMEARPDYLSKDVDFDLFWRVWNMAKAKYVNQPINEVGMFYGAIAGMVASLGDPYSVFFEPQTAKEFSAELAGTLEGIGAELGVKNNQITIITPLADSPAEAAGIKAGDKILAIDGVDTTGMSVDYAVKLIRGPAGTKVNLTIGRDGLAKAEEITITRAKIVIKSVQWRMLEKENIAYLRISQFSDVTVAEFDRAVKKIVAQQPKGLVVDLRGNPGGYLDASVQIAGDWVKDGVIVYEQFTNDIREEYRTRGAARLLNIPTVVLVNNGSASASEILAGALQDYGLAKLVGEKTFGKGSVQDYETFKDGSALKITIAEWLTPKERNINKEGIVPDVEVKLTEDDFKAGKDPQLEKAVELLK
ncbi:MAG: S41 family peptidase [Patescibacteria group bacterium]